MRSCPSVSFRYSPFLFIEISDLCGYDHIVLLCLCTTESAFRRHSATTLSADNMRTRMSDIAERHYQFSRSNVPTSVERSQTASITSAKLDTSQVSLFGVMVLPREFPQLQRLPAQLAGSLYPIKPLHGEQT